MKNYELNGRKNIRLIYSIDVNLYTKDDVYARIMIVKDLPPQTNSNDSNIRLM